MTNKRMKHRLFAITLLSASLTASATAPAWLPVDTVGTATVIVPPASSPTLEIARGELVNFYPSERPVRLVKTARENDGYTIGNLGDTVTVTAGTDLGLLYGAYHLLGGRAEGDFAPAYGLRLLNHWDNLDGTVERGYAGHSLWDWESLPDSVSPRYTEYARANASLGINGTVLNNVNASPRILSREYLEKVARLADIFRPYGVRVYLSVNFASPMVLGKLKTADPLDRKVARWWADKADEIYRIIPDFGGFLVKANSEGQPGPMDFGRTHAEGANMLARALKPHGGVVMWRSFVYSPNDADRAKQAYNEFRPLDGQFDDNVIVQIKNGPIDFQPREPFSPLFGAMPLTQEMAELQVTQEYLGHANHTVYLGPMWSEFFAMIPNRDTLSGVAGVANIGESDIWTGNPMAQLNWYAYGRLAWNPREDNLQIVSDWLDNTHWFDPTMPAPMRDRLEDMLLGSHEAAVSYMMPMGLHHIFAFGHHYGPEPWCDVPGARPDWLPKYYHQADSAGVGFDRTATGSNAIGQYPGEFRRLVENPATCPREYLLWFHHVPWSQVWTPLCHQYESGLNYARAMEQTWTDARPYVAPEIWSDVARRMSTQAKDARWWKDACLLYFQQFSRQPIPEGISPVEHSLPALERVTLGISNYENPPADLLDGVR